jgi:hypothetical protein
MLASVGAAIRLGNWEENSATFFTQRRCGTLKKFWRWAYQLGYIDVEPMARMRPLDAWAANG